MNQDSTLTILDRLKISIIRFPPDLTFGYIPNSKNKFRITVSVIQLFKNILPLLVLAKVESGLWDRQYDTLGDLIDEIVKLIPYLLTLIVIFPLSAAENRLDKNWETFLAEDYQTFKYNFRKALPIENKMFDIYNNKMDILNKVTFYLSFGAFSTGLIIDASFKLVLIIAGILLYLTQGYLGATQHDIVSRVKIKTIFDKKR